MIGKEPFEQLITAAEAMDLFRFAGMQEIYIAKELRDLYREQEGRDSDREWDMLRLLSFAYDTGRVQGIREARKRSKAV